MRETSTKKFTTGAFRIKHSPLDSIRFIVILIEIFALIIGYMGLVIYNAMMYESYYIFWGGIALFGFVFYMIRFASEELKVLYFRLHVLVFGSLLAAILPIWAYSNGFELINFAVVTILSCSVSFILHFHFLKRENIENLTS